MLTLGVRRSNTASRAETQTTGRQRGDTDNHTPAGVRPEPAWRFSEAAPRQPSCPANVAGALFDKPGGGLSLPAGAFPADQLPHAGSAHIAALRVERRDDAPVQPDNGCHRE